jgi:hypothetical protein
MEGTRGTCEEVLEVQTALEVKPVIFLAKRKRNEKEVKTQ